MEGKGVYLDEALTSSFMGDVSEEGGNLLLVLVTGTCGAELREGSGSTEKGRTSVEVLASTRGSSLAYDPIEECWSHNVGDTTTTTAAAATTTGTWARLTAFAAVIIPSSAVPMLAAA